MTQANFYRLRARDRFLAGIQDETVIAKTGRNWAQWETVLDTYRAAERGFSDSARHLCHEYEVSTWWSNTITARYFWVRGLRDG